MTVLQDITKSILEVWNKELAKVGEEQVELKVTCKNKTFYVSRENSYEQRVAELTLYKRGKEDLLLFRKEYKMPEKVANTPSYKIEESYIESLYKNFLYEAIGLFTISCEQLIKSQDYAPYDVEKDRLCADPEFEGIIVKTIAKGEWYEEGNTFDVFTKLEDGYGVYTAHDAFKGNNGIAKLLFKDVEVIESNGKDISVPMSETAQSIMSNAQPSGLKDKATLKKKGRAGEVASNIDTLFKK